MQNRTKKRPFQSRDSLYLAVAADLHFDAVEGRSKVRFKHPVEDLGALGLGVVVEEAVGTRGGVDAVPGAHGASAVGARRFSVDWPAPRWPRSARAQ